MILPPDFGAVTPYLVVDDGQRYLRFLVEGLGGVFVGQHLDAHNRIRNAQVRFNQSTLMLSDSSEAFKATTGHYLLYVDDVHQRTAAAVAFGAELIQAASEQPYGDIQSGVRDFANNIWWITQRLTPKAYY
jgi:PhnB protein